MTEGAIERCSVFTGFNQAHCAQARGEASSTQGTFFLTSTTKWLAGKWNKDMLRELARDGIPNFVQSFRNHKSCISGVSGGLSSDDGRRGI
jgi:hypothetical protein